MKFLFDEMLEKAARWARMFGLDSEIAKGQDEKILALAKTTKRILVTRDRELARNCEKSDVRCFFISATDVATQLRELEVAAGKKLFSFPEKTRCPLCNTPLVVVKKSDIAGRAPPSVLARHKKFWLCKTCGKVYWRGGHWRNILKIKRKLIRQQR